MTTTPQPPPPVEPPAKPQAAEAPGDFSVALAKAVANLASLKLTVVLLGMSIFLVFVGSLAQVHMGIWDVLDNYFRTWLARVELRAFNTLLPEGYTMLDYVLPFPGGKTLGLALLVNLLAAHATRFKYSWRKSGIMIIHIGVITLLLSEYVTAGLAEEMQVRFRVGQTVNSAEDIREFELAIIDPTDPMQDTVWVVPESRLQPGRTLTDASLPVHVAVTKLYPNSRLKSPNDGSGDVEAERVPEASGVSSNEPVDLASAYVQLIDPATGEKTPPTLVSQWFLQGPTVMVAGKPYRLDFRFKRFYKPYLIQLNDLKHEVYVGTNRPKNFQSTVTLFNPYTNERFTQVIRMNEPLRYRGETFYQHQMTAARGESVLQVVDNPGWLIPYISCSLVGLGLIVQFGLSLTRFAGREAKR